MPRRIEIELTSTAADGSWTWRAAGARQPRGIVGSELVPAGAAAGDVLRAEVESGMEGLEIVEVLPKPEPGTGDKRKVDRIEVIGAPRSGPDVSVTLAPGSRRRREDGPPRRGPGRDGGAPRDGQRGGEPARRPSAGGAPSGRGAPGRSPAGAREGSRGADERAPGRAEQGRGPGGRRERRPTASTAHRNAVLAALPPEQLPIAEQLLRGGLPAVRQAIDEQNAAARAAGKPPASADALLQRGEALLPVIRLAEWKDRATSAQSAGRELRLRELRAVVAASRTVTLDEEGRALAKTLREALDGRVSALADDWVTRIATALDEGRVVDALRISANAPEPGTRCPAELAVRLNESAGAAMTAERTADDWLSLLEAVVESPVRRTVKPAGIPEGEALHAAARNAAGLVPELAKLLGLRIPPPPPRRPPARRPLSRTGGGGPTGAP